MSTDTPFSPAGPESTGKPANFRTTALIVASALFMEQLDSTVLSTALPTMAHSFGVSPLAMSVALTAYLLSLAVFIPASGWVADRFGARRVFCTAILLFSLGSILCAQSPSLLVLTLARVLQGLGGAMMVPVGRLILLRSVAKKDLVAAMSWFLVPALIGPVLGPPLGGAVVSYLSWRWIFYINLPIGLVGLVLARLFIADVKEPSGQRFDGVGLVFSGVALAMLTFGLEMSSRGVISGRTGAAMVAIGLASGAIYLFHARHHPAPILDPGLMRAKSFSLSVKAGSLTRITAGALPFLLPMMMQIGFGMSAAQSGLVTFATAAGSVVMKALATPVLRRFGFRTVLIWNGILASGTVAICAAFRPAWPMPAIYAVLLLGGLFQSLQFTAYNTLAYDEISPARMSAATSFYTTFQQLMLSLGISVAAAILHWSMSLSGRTVPAFADFSVAFLVVTGISLMASPLSATLPANAGSVISGHRAVARSHETSGSKQPPRSS